MCAIPITEQENLHSRDMDLMETARLCELINTEDHLPAIAVRRVLPRLVTIADNMIERFSKGGRILYLGAGTSARIAVMDAAECPPTFGIDAQRVQVRIAGGEKTVFLASESNEDSSKDGATAVVEFGAGPLDCVIGLAASGKTPFVLDGLRQAREQGAFTALLSASDQAPDCADVVVRCITGPEVLTGSTRLQAGTAEKMMVNMLSTVVMVKTGRTYGNRMCYITTGNNKLSARAILTLEAVCDVSREKAEALIKDAGNNLACAIVMGMCNIGANEAAGRLRNANGSVRRAIMGE